METLRTDLKSKSLQISLFTWVIVLLVSDFTNAIWQAVHGEPPAWLFGAKVGLLLAFILVSLVWKPIQIVRTYFFLLLALYRLAARNQRLSPMGEPSELGSRDGWIPTFKIVGRLHHGGGVTADGKAMEGFLLFTGAARRIHKWREKSGQAVHFMGVIRSHSGRLHRTAHTALFWNGKPAHIQHPDQGITLFSSRATFCCHECLR
jgi:hypothetical protein